MPGQGEVAVNERDPVPVLLFQLLDQRFGGSAGFAFEVQELDQLGFSVAGLVTRWLSSLTSWASARAWGAAGAGLLAVNTAYQITPVARRTARMVQIAIRTLRAVESALNDRPVSFRGAESPAPVWYRLGSRRSRHLPARNHEEPLILPGL